MANTLSANLSTAEMAAEIFFLEKTGRSLADKVLRKIDDDSYSWQDIVDEFNNCLEYLAGLFDLAELEHIEDVSTDLNSNRVALPANFMKNLWQCKSITYNRPVTVHDTVINLFRRYSVLDTNGVVRDVAVKGRFLYYQRIPSTAETLRLTYYRYPDRLFDRDDKPTCLPAHLVKPLLVNYACKEIFSEIEDGIEGQQVNTDRYTKLFDEAQGALLKFLGPPRREPVEFSEEIVWDAFI